jgi:hypothetical protein
LINLADAKPENKRFRALFVGVTGVGKTIAATSWPGKTLIFDFDKRHGPILEWHKSRLKDYDVEIVTPKNFWEVFHKKINSLADYCPYDNIIVDSITNLSNCVVVMQMIAKGDITKEQAKSGEKTGIKLTKGGVSVPTWDEINGETMIITQLLEVLKSFDVNLIVCAHPLMRQKGSNDYESLVTFGPKVESLIPTYFDNIWYFGLNFLPQNPNDATRRVFTRPSIDYKMARCINNNVPPVIDVTNKSLYEAVKDTI